MNNEIKNVIQKYDVFHRRVSTQQQSLEMQMTADEEYRMTLDESEYVEFNELGISSNKVPLSKRDKMREIIKMIQSGSVKTIYTYDRTRLTRNFYEYLELVDLFLMNDINVVFTTNDSYYPPFSSNPYTEGFNGVLIEEEGKAIARRMSDVNKRVPPKKYGYNTIKHANHKEYKLDSRKQLLFGLFESAQNIINTEEFLKLLHEYKTTKLKKDPIQIINILTDAFYAGHEKVGKKYNQLTYVEPVVSIDAFERIQKVIGPYVKQLNKDLQGRVDEDVLRPRCGECQKEMRYVKNKVGGSGSYSCSNKHKKVSISVDDYNELLFNRTLDVLKSLDQDKLRELANKMLCDLMRDHRNSAEQLHKKIMKTEEQLTCMSPNMFIEGKYEPILFKLNDLKKDRKEINDKILFLEYYQSNIGQLVTGLDLIRLVSTNDIQKYVGILVAKTLVDSESIVFHFYFCDYVNKDEIRESVLL
ncbi:recombinase family protein [Bacillus sp. HMF5848]|uniref:recombinase family protein n=1 Tax=Bacillus sp. HMF5848 TaxID=2495421 RepID=UPI000F7AA5CA|nr:recombinase family protein [Bacillus sp. HMF5848]RSK26541.1 recombinase family protein [Bacillus sp. HMF5848]